MKRKTAIVMALVMVLSMLAFTACGAQSKTDTVALCIDIADVNSSEFTKQTWEAVRSEADKHALNAKLYTSDTADEAALLQTVDKAASEGAKLIFCLGETFHAAVIEAQKAYPEAKLVLADGYFADEDSRALLGENTMAIAYDNKELGFLAGYAAYKEGAEKPGFFGGADIGVVAEQRAGFAAGVNYAAITGGGATPEIVTTYADTFEAGDAAYQKATVIFGELGADVVYACAGGAGSSVIKAAAEKGGRVIGADADQSAYGECVMTSAKKDLQGPVRRVIEDYAGGTFEGGTVLEMTIANGGVQLEMTNGRFETFTPSDYYDICSKLSDGSINIDMWSVTLQDIIIEAIEEGKGNIMDTMSGYAERLREWLGTTAQSIGKSVDELWTQISDGIGAAGEKLSELVDSVFGGGEPQTEGN